MFGIDISGYIPEIDVPAYMQALHAHIEEQIKIGAKKFAEAALTHIPVHTGFAAGSFGALAELLGPHATLNPIIATALKPEYYEGVLKTPTSGTQFVKVSFQWVGDVYEFDFDIDILYFQIQDVFRHNSPTSPWHSFDYGKEAMMAYLTKVAGLAIDDFIVNNSIFDY